MTAWCLHREPYQPSRAAKHSVKRLSWLAPQFEEDYEDDWLVHEDEEEGAPGAAVRRRRRRAGLEGMPGVDADALEVGCSWVAAGLQLKHCVGEGSVSCVLTRRAHIGTACLVV